MIALPGPPARGEPAGDPNNLADPAWLRQAGERVPGGSWDGSDAVRSREGTPSFGVPLWGDRAALYRKLRGRWLKLYLDTVGGGFNLGLQDMKTGAFRWIQGTSSPDPKNWRRLSHTFRFPDEAFAQPTLYFYNLGDGRLYDNLRLYLLGSEPAELLEAVDRAGGQRLQNLLADPSFEDAGEAAVLAPGWRLAGGGARVVAGSARTGKRSLRLTSASTVESPELRAEAGVPLLLHFWVRGRGSLSVRSLDLDAAGVPLVEGAATVGTTLAAGLSAQDRWVKVELTAPAYHPSCRARQIVFEAGEGGEVHLDDVQLLRDTANFPFPPRQRNPFRGEFTAAGGRVTATLNGKPLARNGALTGPAVLLLQVSPEDPTREVRVGGGLAFPSGGVVGPDRHWKMTTRPPGDGAADLGYDDATWQPAPVSPDGMALVVPAGGPAWLRRVILWDTTPYLVPRVTELPFDVGRADWLNLALVPPLRTKVETFQLLVDLPGGYRVVPYSGNGAYLRAPKKVEEDARGAEHAGARYRRFVVTYAPGDITGVSGAYRGGNARTSTLLLEHAGGPEPVEGTLYLTRVVNGNAVDLPLPIALVRVPLDGARPKRLIVHDLWTPPYVFGNPPNAQLNIEAVDQITQTCVRSGMTHSGWPGLLEPYVRDPKYGPGWLEPLRRQQVRLMPVYHNFPFLTQPGKPAYAVAEKAPGAVAELRTRKADGKEVPEALHVSFGWLLSDASAGYWDAVREEYRRHTAELEEGTGLKVFGYVWDYEFEVDSYARADDPLTLQRFAEYAGLPAVPEGGTARAKHPGPWEEFSRWACRQVIRRTHDRVFKPLGLRFHVYFGEGRPFDPGNCDLVSAFGVGQNVAGQIPSVRAEYDAITRGLKIDPKMEFLGILQAEIQAVHRGRPFHWQELRNNLVKRTIATRRGVSLYTEVEPQCPGMPYATAAASRFLARWEPYFLDPEPVFAGEALQAVVKLEPAPAEAVLLKKGSKGLLLLFGGEPERQPEAVRIRVTPADGEGGLVTLPPMGLWVSEIELR